MYIRWFFTQVEILYYGLPSDDTVKYDKDGHHVCGEICHCFFYTEDGGTNSSKTSIPIDQTTWLHTSEDLKCH